MSADAVLWIIVSTAIIGLIILVLWMQWSNVRTIFYSIREYAPSEVKHSVYLIGDAGAMSPKRDLGFIGYLSGELAKSGKDSAIVFLGDNIYPRGMPHAADLHRKRSEMRLSLQLDMVKDYPGKVFFLGGNHDWNKGRKDGWERWLRQEEFIDKHLGASATVPRHGCPDPIEILLSDNFTLLILNTQWWVQRGPKPIGKKDGCLVETEIDFFDMLSSILEKNKDRQVLIAAHHPLYSNAIHGGKFSYKQHLFPLTALHRKLYVPLPLAGSLYPFYRRAFGAAEDISHPLYRKLRKKLLKIFKKYPNLIYAAGHDHNLQHLVKGKQHYIVSGSASKLAYVQKRGANYARARQGFFCIRQLHNNDIIIEAWIYLNSVNEPHMAYQYKVN
ncbi:MAG: metallophosphoesterase [Bacteroidota bacterium]|nr:metallophosphoesterase [Bacteroidota bacterium]